MALGQTSQYNMKKKIIQQNDLNRRPQNSDYSVLASMY